MTRRAEKTPAKALTGFALMSAERRREVASMGGSTSQGHGTAHAFTSENAPIYGRQGAQKRWKKKKRATIKKAKENVSS